MKTFALCLLLACRVHPALTQTGQWFVSFDSTRIYYEDSGGNGPAVLLVHGFIVHSGMWKNAPLRKSLLDNGFRVIAVDLRGAGQSDKPHALSRFQNDAEVRDLIGLMRSLSLPHYSVVGYSRGAILTAKLLTLDKKHVRSAVLGGMGADFLNPNWKRRLMFQDAFSGKAHLWPETQRAVAYAKSSGADTTCLALMQAAQPFTERRRLERVNTKVLVIAGTDDKDNGDAAELAAILRRSTLKRVPGNHNNTASSVDFGAEVTKFLQQR